MRILFDFKNFYNRFALASILIIIFFCLYQTIPDEEFENVKRPDDMFDKFRFSLANQTGVRDQETIKPITRRAQLLSTIQIILGYSIFLL